MEPALLGTPGDWVVPTDPADAYDTKAGGPPIWPAGAQPPPKGLTSCPRCGGATSLVLQAYAPLRASELSPAGSSDLPERYLYLFACLAPGCRNEPDAWRAVRAQRVSPVTSAAATGSGEKHAQPGPSSTPVSAPPVTDWSAAADDWSGGGDGGAGGGSSQADLSSLATELDAALAVSSAADAQGGKHRVAASSAAGSTGGSTQLQRRPAPGPNALPEFFISAEDEPEDEDGGSASRRVDPKAMPLEAMAAALAGDEDEKAKTSGGESWAGEAYESTTVRGVPKQFLRFQKRLRKCPEQCVRYGVAAEPMWPTTRRPQAWLAAQHQLPSAQQRNSGGAAPVGTACASCRGSLRFEAQLMAPLIHFFCQGAESDGALSDALLDWEWTTVVLLTCGRSCYSGTGNEVQYTFEHLWVDNAEDTEALRKALAHADAAAVAAADAPVVAGADADGDVSMDDDANAA